MSWSELEFTNLLAADFSGNNFKAPGRISIMPAFTLQNYEWHLPGPTAWVSSDDTYPDISAAVWNIDIVSGDTAVSLSRSTPPLYYDEEIDGRYYKTTGVSRTIELAPDLVVGKVAKETTMIIGMTLGTLYAETEIVLKPTSSVVNLKGIYPTTYPSVFYGLEGLVIDER